MVDRGIELLVFVGGDGTARDMCDAIDYQGACGRRTRRRQGLQFGVRAQRQSQRLKWWMLS